MRWGRALVLIGLVLLAAGCVYGPWEIYGGISYDPIGTPQGSASPTPTATHTPTYTPSATPTPTATNTPTATSTSTPVIEPTAEDFRTPSPTPIPTDTPAPTVSPTPQPGCLGQNLSGDPINVRVSAQRFGEWLGKIQPGQYIHPEGIYHGDDFDWYLIWWDVVEGQERYAWTADFYDEITDCSGLIEVSPYQLGVHLLTGFQCSLAYKHPDLAIKGVSSTENCFRELMDAFPERQFVWRTLILGDGMQGWMTADPIALANARYAAEKTLWHAYDLWRYMVNPAIHLHVEVLNEQAAPPAEWAVAFWLQMLRNATADGVCLAILSDGYGNPTYAQFAAYAPLFEYIVSHPCQPNRLHAISLHSYSPGVDSSGNPVYDQWLFNLWEEFWALIADQIGRQAYLVPVIITELGVPNIEGEYLGRGTPDCARAWRELEIIDREIFSTHPEVYAAYIFGAGNVSTWLDFSPCLSVY